AAFEASLLDAGAGLLALVAVAGGLAVAGTRAAALAGGSLAGALGRFQFMQIHALHLLTAWSQRPDERSWRSCRWWPHCRAVRQRRPGDAGPTTSQRRSAPCRGRSGSWRDGCSVYPC